ncbi:MAG: hypothetical protein HYX93_06330 [Chloroflexi bacterium]|nr:hypothetical protein [Chloroflexota bacterium]
MSKLIERLTKVGTVASTPMGFGANRNQEKVPSLLVMGLSGATLPQSPSQLQVDSLVILIDRLAQAEVEAAKSVAGDTLWGLWPENPGENSLDSLKSEGGDFFVLPTVNTPAALLATEGLGRLIALPVDFPEELRRSLEELPIDAILLAGLERAAPLSVRDLMQVRSFRDRTSKPILLVRSHALKQGELAVLQEAGIQGVVLDLRAINGEEITQMREAIGELPPRKGRRESQPPILPRPTIRAFTPQQQEEEEEEDEDD